MPASPADAWIGPNAILQTAEVLERRLGPAALSGLLARAGIARLPDGRAMVPEEPAARLHQAVRAALPDAAPDLAAEAGRATADYILAHRIPRAAQTVLRALPAPLAVRALARAIERHAWTFAGSGSFRVLSPYCFEIADNPIIRGERSDHALCDWHAAVFERLYRALVAPGFRCRETACGAVNGAACRFEMARR